MLCFFAFFRPLTREAAILQSVPTNAIQEVGAVTYNPFSGQRPKLTSPETYAHGKTSFLPPHRAAHKLRFIAAEGKVSTEYIFSLPLFQVSLSKACFFKKKKKKKKKKQ